jgi:acetyl esterase/lipase
VAVVPYGYLSTVLLAGIVTALVVLAPRQPRVLGRFSWWASLLVSELTVWVMLYLVASTVLLLAQHGVHGVATAVGVAVAVLLLGVLGRELALSARVGAVARAALADDGGPALASAVPLGEWVRSLLFPRPSSSGLRRVREVGYGPLPHQLMDVYTAEPRAAPGPVLVQLHGGGFVGGRRSKESLGLLYQLAREGWVCVSADYLLGRSPADGHPQHLIDVKQLIAWLRSEGQSIGADPITIVLVGTSAGAHLSAMAALTAGDPRYQPGFESADTSISGWVGLAGYYGPLTAEPGAATSPFEHLDDAPPAPGLVVHGSRDTQTSPDDARRLVHELRDRSASCAFALLPGANHTFDLLDSVRFRLVREATATFCRSVTVRARDDPARSEPEPPTGDGRAPP